MDEDRKTSCSTRKVINPYIGIMVRVTIAICILTNLQPIADGLQGRHFHLSALNSVPLDPVDCHIEIFISSTSEGTFTISNFFGFSEAEKSKTYSLTSKNLFLKTISMKLPANMPPINKTSNFSVVISSTVDISVQVNRAEPGSGGGYLALPLTSNSTRFSLVSYSSDPSSRHFGQASIVSAYNDTKIRINRVKGTSRVEILQLNLMENEVYTLGAGPDVDLTGLEVTSSAPISVFSGHSCAAIPSTANTTCDYIIEQLPPVSQWGTTFLASNYGKHYETGFVIRVVVQSLTFVTYCLQTYDSANSPLETIRARRLQAGDWDEVAFNSSSKALTVVLVNCSVNCLVMQYNPSFVRTEEARCENTKPNSFMITVPDINHHSTDVKFSVSQYVRNGTLQKCRSMMTVIAEHENMKELKMNGRSIANLGLKTYAVNVSRWTRYSIFHVLLDDGQHIISSKDQMAKFAVFVYGHETGDAAAYGYLGGYKYIYSKNNQPIVQILADVNRENDVESKPGKVEGALFRDADITDEPKHASSKTGSSTTIVLAIGISFVLLAVALVGGLIFATVATRLNSMQNRGDSSRPSAERRKVATQGGVNKINASGGSVTEKKVHHVGSRHSKGRKHSGTRSVGALKRHSGTSRLPAPSVRHSGPTARHSNVRQSKSGRGRFSTGIGSRPGSTSIYTKSSGVKLSSGVLSRHSTSGRKGIMKERDHRNSLTRKFY